MRWPWTWKTTRDAILFVVGLAGIAYETLAGHEPRPELLVIFGGMAGLPAFLRSDERKGDNVKPPDDPPPTVGKRDRELADALIALLGDRMDEVRRGMKATAYQVQAYPRTAAWAGTALTLAVVIQ